MNSTLNRSRFAAAATLATGIALKTLVVGAVNSLAVPLAQAQDIPDRMMCDLLSTVRDFKVEHPDFDSVASAGHGHYAGNVLFELGLDYRPAPTNSACRRSRSMNCSPIPTSILCST